MAGMPALRGDRIGLYAPVKSHCMRSCTLLERSVPPVSYEGGAGGGGGDTDGPLLVEPVGPPSTTLWAVSKSASFGNKRVTCFFA